MPRGDGTGPLSQGPLTGRGFGFCSGGAGVGYGRGFGYGLGRGSGFRCGFGMGAGRGFGRGFMDAGAQKELLTEQKAFFEEKLELINKQLEDL